MGYQSTATTLDPTVSPIQRAVQRIIRCSRLTVTSIQDLPGHLHRICIVHLSNESLLVLKVDPAPSTFLLRHERESLENEATVLDLLSRSSLPIPRVVKHERRPEVLGSPFLLITHMTGATYKEACPHMTRTERSCVELQLRSLTSSIGQQTSQAFGPAGTVDTKGHKDWRGAFTSMFESILMDGEDAMVNVPYFQIREAISGWESYLDDVTEARLIVLGLGRLENVLVDGKTNEITGLLDFGQAVWGDTALMSPEGRNDIKGLLWVRLTLILTQCELILLSGTNPISLWSQLSRTIIDLKVTKENLMLGKH